MLSVFGIQTWFSAMRREVRVRSRINRLVNKIVSKFISSVSLVHRADHNAARRPDPAVFDVAWRSETWSFEKPEKNALIEETCK